MLIPQWLMRHSGRGTDGLPSAYPFVPDVQRSRVHLRLEVVRWCRQCNITENMRNYRKSIAFVCSRRPSCTAVRDTKAVGQWKGQFERKIEEEGEYKVERGLRSVLIGIRVEAKRKRE